MKKWKKLQSIIRVNIDKTDLKNLQCKYNKNGATVRSKCKPDANESKCKCTYNATYDFTLDSIEFFNKGEGALIFIFWLLCLRLKDLVKLSSFCFEKKINFFFFSSLDVNSRKVDHVLKKIIYAFSFICPF